MYKPSIDRMKSVYDKYKNLKLAAQELDMKWQNLYYHLHKNGHPVIGDKQKYGSSTDRMAKEFEDLFQEWIPYAKDSNVDKFQAKVDFTVKGYKVDIKSSTKKDGAKSNPNKNPALRWAFCVSVQEQVHSDFLVCFCTTGTDCEDYGNIERILLIPYEFYKNKQSISVSTKNSKWFDFEVTKEELIQFFDIL